MTPMRAAFFAATLALSATTSAGCGASDSKYLYDPGFDVWCGDSLCNWSVEEGSITKASTWHPGDAGVELVGPTVVLSQIVEFKMGPPKCLDLRFVADVHDTSLSIELDFAHDGTVDHTIGVPSQSWASLTYKVPAPGGPSLVKLSFRKEGPGRTVLALVSFHGWKQC